MATVILLRHARSTANGSGVLAGRTSGVRLDQHGAQQAADLITRLAGIDLAAIVQSPQLRCRQTLAPLLTARRQSAVTDARLSEVDYGEWSGVELQKLVKDPLWRVVQTHPSAVTFPGGERLASVQTRAVTAIRSHDALVTAEHGPEAVWLACSHADVIKAVLADALGMHLDAFQRIVVDPCSASAVRYTETRPFVLRMNDLSADLTGIVPPKPSRGGKRKRRTVTRNALSSDAVVGGNS